MKFLRSLIASLSLAALTSTAQAQTVLFREDFESGYAGWTLTGLWNPEASTDPCGQMSSGHPGSVFPSGTQCAYYGLPSCNYDTPLPNYGRLTSIASVALPPSGRARLRFWNSRFAECLGFSADDTTVHVSADGGSTWPLIGQVCYPPELGGSYQWHPREYDLSAFLGQSILVRFAFDTIDTIENGYLGWFIDDVSVLWDASTILCPAEVLGSCPCNNGPANGVLGCTNSTGRAAEFVAIGVASVSADSIRLDATRLPPSASILFFQAAAKTSGGLFGDGRLCASGPFVRLGLKTASSGAAAYPTPGEAPVSVAGHLPAGGGTRAYQAFFRDVVSFCTPATFNVTSSFELVWSP